MVKLALFRRWTAFWLSGLISSWAKSRNLCGIAIVLLATFIGSGSAADLKPETIEAWQNSIQAADAQMQDRLRHDSSFLWVDESSERRQRVRGGEIVASPADAHNPMRVPGGLVHRWIGAAFLPNTKLEDVFAVVRDYSHYGEYFHPVVMCSKALTADRFSLILMNRSMLQHNALDSDYQSNYVRVDARRWYSVSRTTRMQEIADYGQPDERELPAGTGSGYIWRLYSITRFEERDGGVYVEVDAMALSRDIPASVRWLADPIVRRISKGSLVTSLRQTQEAVGSMAARVISVPKTYGFRQE